MSYSYYATSFYGLVLIGGPDADVSALAEIDETQPQSRRPEVVRAAQVLTETAVYAGRFGNGVSGDMTGMLYIPESLIRTSHAARLTHMRPPGSWYERLESALTDLGLESLIRKIDWYIAADYW